MTPQRIRVGGTVTQAPRLVASADHDWLLLDDQGRLLGKVRSPRATMVFGRSAPTLLLQCQPDKCTATPSRTQIL